MTYPIHPGMLWETDEQQLFSSTPSSTKEWMPDDTQQVIEMVQSPDTRKGRMMELDNQGNPVDFNEVMTRWYSTDEAGKRLNIGQAAITYLCREGKLRAYRIIREWRVEPQSVADYVPEKPGRKPKG